MAKIYSKKLVQKIKPINNPEGRRQKLRSILQVTHADLGGGSDHIARMLFQSYRAMGFDSHLVVGYKDLGDPDIIPLRHEKGQRGWSWLWWRADSLLRNQTRRVRGTWRLARLARWIANPKTFLNYRQGLEDFNFPGTRYLLDIEGTSPDILHLHNLAGDYFDLRLLSEFSSKVPTVLTLHDAWLLSGHCAFSFDCQRWETGCGSCPDLSIYPPVLKDATAENWKRKRDIFAVSKLWVAAPSNWLMNQAQSSILSPSIRGARVIPNGIDLSIFKQADRVSAREQLGFPQAASILMFAASGIRNNPWKDYKTLREVVARLATDFPGLMLIALGDSGPDDKIGDALIHFVPFQADPSKVAQYYQSADIYLHATRVESWGLVISEAMACGIPVVASSVGGTLEQIEDGYSGFLVPVGDPRAMAAKTTQLLENDTLRQRIGRNAAMVAQERFGFEFQVKSYLNWYSEIIADFSKDQQLSKNYGS